MEASDDKGLYIPTPEEIEAGGGDHFAKSEFRGFSPDSPAWNLFGPDEDEDNKK